MTRVEIRRITFFRETNGHETRIFLDDADSRFGKDFITENGYLDFINFRFLSQTDDHFTYLTGLYLVGISSPPDRFASIEKHFHFILRQFGEVDARRMNARLDVFAEGDSFDKAKAI